MEQGVVFIDDQNLIAYGNPAAEKALNAQVDKFLGQSLLVCHPPQLHAKVLDIIDELKSGKALNYHSMNIPLTDDHFYDHTYSAVRGPGNKYLGVIVVIQEVTNRKRAEDELKETMKRLQLANEELKVLDRMKDDFLSNVSHELKTPMISVIGYIGIMLRDKGEALNDRQRKYLEISYKNLLKLEHNINDLLDLAEFGIRKEVYSFEPVDLVRVIEFSCLTLEPLAKEHQIVLVKDLSPGPVLIPGVEEKLNQVFDNLLTNAIKYNHKGGRILVSLEENRESVFIQVMDTGVGISHQSLNEVFTRYYRGKTSSLGKAKGLGIGLSLVQEIVRLHRGEISIDSQIGKGSVFTVMFPKQHQGSGSET